MNMVSYWCYVEVDDSVPKPLTDEEREERNRKWKEEEQSRMEKAMKVFQQKYLPKQEKSKR